jgi:hypothetical protein
MNLTPKKKKKKTAPKIMQLAAQLSPTGSVLSFNHAWMLTYMNGGISAQGQQVSGKKNKMGCPENVIACPEM